MIYIPSNNVTFIRQGEILSNLTRLTLSLESIGSEPKVDLIKHEMAIVISQDCDLDQDYKARNGGNKPDKKIKEILFCHLPTAAEIRGAMESSKLWERIKQNNDSRYHFLQKADPTEDAAGEGLPEMAIDFKHYFTLPSDEIYKKIELKNIIRRCYLNCPYVQHLSHRFAGYLSRVGLPLDHASDPN